MNLASKSIYITVLLFVSVSTFKIQKKHLRIINGYPSERCQYPYFVFLEGINMQDNKKMNACGGSLISDLWVLTAGHCFLNVSVIHVHLGSHRLMNIYEPGRIVMSAGHKQYFPHPDFQLDGVKNDIGLLRLPKRIEFSQSIQKINMPSTCDSNENIDVIGLGDGLIDVKTTDLSPVLQWASFKTITSKECNVVYPFLENRTTVICIESPKEVGSSICYGDSGSGLIRKSDNTLIGVASFVAHSGCDKNLPQVFTNIVKYHSWISNVTGLDLIQC